MSVFLGSQGRRKLSLVVGTRRKPRDSMWKRPCGRWSCAATVPGKAEMETEAGLMQLSIAIVFALLELGFGRERHRRRWRSWRADRLDRSWLRCCWSSKSANYPDAAEEPPTSRNAGSKFGSARCRSRQIGVKPVAFQMIANPNSSPSPTRKPFTQRSDYIYDR